MKSRIVVVTSLVAATLVAAQAWAMHITTSISVVGFSKDGASALLEQREHGPEGGGSTSYEVVSAEGPNAQFLVSSNFSTGGGDRPETVDAASCTAEAKKFAKLLADKGFEGVTVKPEACAKERGSIVSAKGVDGGEEAQLSVVKGKLVFSVKGRSVELLAAEKDLGAVEGRISKSGKLLVVLAGEWDGKRVLGAWRARGDGFEQIPGVQ